jgi:PPOX class probable F420-dependent enzyme
VNEEEARRRFVQARVGRLATAGPDGAPHVVPFVFAVNGDRIYTEVDDKPKRSTSLKRTANIRANPRASALVDHYEDDWHRLWWVRADGSGRVVEEGPDRDRGLALLREKYDQYRRVRDPGPVIVIEVDRWRSWSYS